MGERLEKLPGWVVDDRASVLREVAPYRAMTPRERLELLRAACASALPLLALNKNRERVLAWRDPLPASTQRALARLREQLRG